MTNEEVKEWSNLVAQVSYMFAKRYKIIDRDDIAQEIWMWFITHSSKMEEWSSLQKKDQTKLVSRSIQNAAIKYCEKEKARVVGYELSDLHYYDKNTIEMFLPYILSNDYELPDGMQLDKTARATKDPSEGNGWLAIRADISTGFDRLPDNHKAILRLRFLNESRTYKQLGDSIGTSEDAVRKRVDRAIAALINKIGGTRP